MNFYTGVGSRSTPKDILFLIFQTAAYLYRKNYVLRSGGANGADSYFEQGADINAVKGSLKEIYLPWSNFNKNVSEFSLEKSPYREDAVQIAKAVWNNRFNRQEVRFEWEELRSTTKLLMARNTMQLCGWTTRGPMSEFVLCWTSDGQASGGTGQAISLAHELGINVINLYYKENRDMIEQAIAMNAEPSTFKSAA